MTHHSPSRPVAGRLAGPVVVGVDGTARSDGALRYAVHEAVLQDAPLVLVHVTGTTQPLTPLPVVAADLRAAGAAVLHDTMARVHAMAPGLEVHTDLRTGSRVRGLVASSRDARLLVLGRETRTGVERLLTGATTAAVVAGTPAPVVVVDAEWTADVGHGRVVVGIKHEDGSAALLGQAFQAAEDRGATLVVVHAWHLPDAYGDLVEPHLDDERWQAQGVEMVEAVLADWRLAHPDVPVEVRVADERPDDALLAASETADLTLVVRRHRDLVHPRVLGPTLRTLLRTAPGPVEVVPWRPLLSSAPGPVLEQAGELVR